MSLDIRYLTNGIKSAYRIRNSGGEQVEIDYYEKKEDIPKEIRHYAPKGEPKFIEPDMAYFLGAGEYFYPNFQGCGLREYYGKRCVAESCKYASPTYKECQYLIKPD